MHLHQVEKLGIIPTEGFGLSIDCIFIFRKTLPEITIYYYTPQGYMVSRVSK